MEGKATGPLHNGNAGARHYILLMHALYWQYNAVELLLRTYDSEKHTERASKDRNKGGRIVRTVAQTALGSTSRRAASRWNKFGQRRGRTNSASRLKAVEARGPYPKKIMSVSIDKSTVHRVVHCMQSYSTVI